MKKDLRFNNFQIKAIKEDGDDLMIEGYGAVFNNIDSYGDVIRKGSFAKTIKERGDRIAFCYQHDIRNPIGKIQEIKEDDFGLWIVVKVSNAEDDIKTKIREKILQEMSIGYVVINANSAMIDGVDVFELTEIRLYEVSLVTVAANDKARITSMKSEQDREDFIDDEVDRLIAVTRDQHLKFELLKLKADFKALLEVEPGITPQGTPGGDHPQHPTPPNQKPQEMKADEILNLFNKYF